MTNQQIESILEFFTFRDPFPNDDVYSFDYEPDLDDYEFQQSRFM